MLPSSPRPNLLNPELTDELPNPKLNRAFPEVSQFQFNRLMLGENGSVGLFAELMCGQSRIKIRA